MKSKIVFLLTLILILGACSPAGDEGDATVADGSGTESTRLAEDYAEALGVQAQLVLGTLMLEETELAVDEALATEILPLWQAVQSLSNSDTAAEAEITAVLNQIQDTMIPEQISSIAAMQLTGDDVETFMAESDFGFRGAPDANGRPQDGTPGQRGQGGGFGGPRSGGGFGEPPPGGLGGDTNFDELTEEELAELFTERLQSGAQLVNPLINLLRQKTGEEVAQPQNGTFLGIVTEATGLSLQEIQAEAADGKTLAEIISENGGDVDIVREELLAFFSQAENADTDAVAERADNLLNNAFQPRGANE